MSGTMWYPWSLVWLENIETSSRKPGLEAGPSASFPRSAQDMECLWRLLERFRTAANSPCRSSISTRSSTSSRRWSSALSSRAILASRGRIRLLRSDRRSVEAARRQVRSTLDHRLLPHDVRRRVVLEPEEIRDGRSHLDAMVRLRLPEERPEVPVVALLIAPCLVAPGQLRLLRGVNHLPADRLEVGYLDGVGQSAQARDELHGNVPDLLDAVNRIHDDVLVPSGDCTEVGVQVVEVGCLEAEPSLEPGEDAGTLPPRLGDLACVVRGIARSPAGPYVAKVLAPAAAELHHRLRVGRAKVDYGLDDRSTVELLRPTRRQLDGHVEGHVPTPSEVHLADLLCPPRDERQDAGQLRFALSDDVVDLREPRAPRRLVVLASRRHVATAVETPQGECRAQMPAEPSRKRPEQRSHVSVFLPSMTVQRLSSTRTATASTGNGSAGASYSRFSTSAASTRSHTPSRPSFRK